MTTNRNGQVVTFYSYKGGTGRTMALANVAWILASNGKRVLAVDWDLESPGLFRFFSPFIMPGALASARGVIELIQEYEWATAGGEPPSDFIERYASVTKYSFSMQWNGFPGNGTLDYLSAGQQNHDYATTLAATSWDDFYEHRSGGEFFDALRADMKRNYDYTLIDSRTGLSDVADICTKQLPDILVDCFTLSDQGIEGAAQVARTVRDDYRRRKIRILPVPMRVDPAEKYKADAGRTFAMQRFSGLPSGMSDGERERYWNSVQVPYQAFYGYEEILATFGDVPGGSGTLLSAYEILTGHITDGEVTALPSIEPAIRTQINARFERRPSAVEDIVILRYAPPDQVWAEWVEHILTAAGLRVVPQEPPEAGTEAPEGEPGPPPGTREIKIISRSNATVESAFVMPDAGSGRTPLAVYIADITPMSNVPIPQSAFVAGLSEATAAERVLALVDRPSVDVPTILAGGPRFPGEETEIFNVPARNTRFTGRESHLWRLREYLRAGATVVLYGKRPTSLQGMPVALHGMGGVGKTQLAIEYAHRFRSAYDVVWWIGTDPLGEIENALADLGSRLGVHSESSGPDTARAVAHALSRSRQRWLLIYDNADEPEAISAFIPHGAGHVLITSRNPLWRDRAQELSVDVFQRRESIAHLIQRVPEMQSEDAWQVAEQLADLPIAIAAAGAWLADTGTPVDEYLRYIRDRGPSAMKEPTSDESIDKTWDLSLNRLRERSPAAYRLFQLCSVMAPEIALDLVYSDQLAAWLRPYDPRVSERLVRGSLVQQINRLALLRVDQRGEGQGRDGGRGGQVLVHRVLQAVVRSRMSDEELAEARREVQQVLAAARPEGEVDEPENWPRFRMLWPHLDVCDAVNSTDEAVRRLVVDRVRYQWLQGDTLAGRIRAEQAVGIWTAALASMSDVRERQILERQLLHLRFNMANILREQGDFHRSRSLNAEILARQTAQLGEDDPHTLMTAGGLAGDLRGLGLYAEALKLDLATYRAWLDSYGEDHPRTLAALNNLAVCYRLMGDFRTARDRDEQALRRRQVVLGENNPFTLASAAQLGRDIRDAGDYERSVTALRAVYQAAVATRGADSRAALTMRSNLAVSLRSAGYHEEALQIHEEVYERLNERFGSDNPETLSCRVSLALSRLSVGEAARAVRDLHELEAHYRQALGERHPHSLVCANNLAIAERASNHPDDARRWAMKAVTGLGEVLGERHPYTVSAQMNLAICEVTAGELEGALNRFQDTLEKMGDVLGPDHPNTLRCIANIALVSRDLGHAANDDRIEDSLARLIDRVGANHPVVKALHKRHYLYRIIDPHPF
jgi:tetratricopeptide (TPR) repeat protein